LHAWDIAIDMSEESPPVRGNSAQRLFRATSLTLTAGALVLPPQPPEPEETPLLGRRRDSDQVQQRLVSELLSFVGLCKVWLVLLLLLMFVTGVIVMVMFFQAIFATIFYQDKPCDQPLLKWYMVFTLLWSQVPPCASSFVRARLQMLQQSALVSFCASVLFSLPGWVILGYGVYMVQHAETCPKTNPQLFYPIERFIYAQIGVALIAFLLTVLGFFSLRYLLLALNRLGENPGCAKAVEKLEVVDKHSPDLADTDGQIMDCPICMEAYSEAGDVVRAPCKHNFHKACLLTWCKNHVDCPMCRQPVGEPDKDESQGPEP